MLNKCIIYVRVSSQTQVEGTSLVSQENACREYAAQKGFSVEQIFIERGESATAINRTEFLKAIEYCRSNKGNITAFVVWKIDRFARNTTDHFAVRAQLTKYGVTLHSVTEPISQDSIGKLMETFLAGYAEFENETRRQRCSQGMKAKLIEGIYPWKPPLGYIHSKKITDRRKTSPDEPDPERFALVQRGLQEFSQGLHTLSSLTRSFQEWGLAARSGRTIRIQDVDRLLKCRYYAGWLTDPWTNELYRGKHTPMVSPDEFEKIQYHRAQNSHQAAIPHTKYNTDFPLRGIIKCICGKQLSGAWRQGRRERYAYYHCFNSKCKYDDLGIHKIKLEQKFLQLLEHITPRQEIVDLYGKIVVDEWESIHEFQIKQRDRMEKEEAKIEKRHQRLIRMRVNGSISEKDFLKHKEDTDNQLIAARISKNESQINVYDMETRISYAKQFISDIPRLWVDLDIHAQHEIAEAMFPDGVIYNKNSDTFGITVLSPIFSLNLPQGAGVDKKILVAGLRDVLHRIMEDFSRFWEIGQRWGYGVNLGVSLETV